MYPDFPKTINYPETITPVRIDLVSKGTTESGYRQTRLKGTKKLHKYTLNWGAMPQEQLKELLDFDEETGRGSKSFYWTLPPTWKDDTPRLVQIDGEISFPKRGKTHNQVSLVLMEV